VEAHRDQVERAAREAASDDSGRQHLQYVEDEAGIAHLLAAGR
jgi:hypothetical protein